MNTKPVIPPLTDQTLPFGAIEFIHTDGAKHRFFSCINEMSGDRLSAFDNDPPSINDPMKWVKSAFRDIHAKAKVIACAGKLAAKGRGK